MASNDTMRPMSRRELEEKIITRAWKDEAFRQRFVADPKGEFEAHLGTQLPASFTMTVHQEDEHNVHFVIPVKPTADLQELSDEDLEKVAGGVDVAVTVVLTIAYAVSVSAIIGTVSASKGEEWSQ